MNLSMLLLSALAGALSTLSPCVLPLIPVVVGSALNAHRLGAWALAGGLAVSFAIFGTAIASAGSALGLSDEHLRAVGAVLLVLVGLGLASGAVQRLLARAAEPLASSGHRLLARATLAGWPGQFLLGMTLGLVWSPCVGPTLGAATVLASRGGDLASVAVMMSVFGLGAAVPLLVLGNLSRTLWVRVRGSLLNVSSGAKVLGGTICIALGLSILGGWDHRGEAWLLDHSPEWLTTLTTRF